MRNSSGSPPTSSRRQRTKASPSSSTGRDPSRPCDFVLCLGPLGKRTTKMTLFEELQRVATRTAPYEAPAVCPWCRAGHLEVIEETPDPNFGALGVSSLTLRC